MFKTKRDVDRHVTHILSRIRDEKEKDSRGFQFAKLYYDVAEYEAAKRYLQGFLSVRGTTPQAHKLMGQIWEALKDKKKALEAYQRCLELDPEQKEVVLKVCELSSDASIEVNADVVNEKVLFSNGTRDCQDLQHLIKEELAKNPANVQLHIQLLRLYMQSRDVEQAYEHVLDTENALTVVPSLEWYETILDVFKVYQDQYGGTDNVTFFTRKLFTMAMFILLRLQSKDCDIHCTVKILHMFDQDLYLAHKVHRDVIEWTGFLAEMKGQLFYLMAVLLLRKALNGQMSWKDASSYSAVCLLLSNSMASVDIQSSWYRQAKLDSKRFYDRLYKAGCDRLSQGGHMIYSFLGKQEGDNDWARKLQRRVCTAHGKDRLHIMIFTEELHRRKNTSYFLQSDIFTETNLEVPAKSLLKKYDAVAYRFHSGELNHLVWLAMQYHMLKDDIQPDYEQIFGYQLYPDMKYSIPDLSSGDPSTLCQLDVQVFLYACIRWAVLENKERKRNLPTIPDEPDFLPVYLSVPYCNAQQIEWWSAVVSMETEQSSEKREKLWGLVMRGLETIRLVVPDALALQLVVHISMTLDARAKEMQSLGAESIVTPKLGAVLHRAEFYWKAAAEMIYRVERNQNIRMSKEMIFPFNNITTDPALIKNIKDQVKFAMATVAMRNQDYDEALGEFESLSRPEAAYNTGLIYQKLAEKVCDSNQNSSGSTDFDQQMALLNKSKSALYMTLDRLEKEKNEELKKKVKQNLADVVSKLMSLESRGAQTDGILKPYIQPSYVDMSKDESDEEPIKPVSPLKTSLMTTPSKVRDMPRISPTRMDVQLKAMEAANLAMLSRVSTLEESVRTNEKMIQEIFSQLRECRDENRCVRDQVQVLSLQGLSGINVCRPQGMLPTSRVNAMNMSLGGNPMYELPVSQHMQQYPFSSSVGSPRPGSAFGQQNYDDSYGYNNGEYYEPDDNACYIPDQNLVQDWPFGQKAGVEGKSTITYSPQQHVRGLNPSNAGMFANLLRGPSIQYGTGYTPQVSQQPSPAQLPGPGYFSLSSQHMQPGSIQTPIGMQEQFTAATKPAAFSHAQVPKVSDSATSASKLVAPMMPPNAVISNSQSPEGKPVLIPGSVGIPASFLQSQTTTTPSGTQAQASSLASSISAKHQDGSKSATLSQTSEQTPQKTLFHGFSFTTPPKIFEVKSDIRPKEIQPPVTTTGPVSNPFSGFSLTQPHAIATSVSSEKSQASAGFMLNSSVSFGSLAAQGQTSPAFQGGGDQKSFPGAGAVMFEKSPSTRQLNTSRCSDENIEEYEPNVDFEPLIQLPEIIEVKTGEEEEEKLFCDRVKLFRFERETQQWKERGVGELKILKHKISKNVRILMRREQVFKLCANHKITADMQLTNMSSSDKAWVWTAADFSEGEIKNQQFAARFKTRDLAEKFKSVFEQCQAELYQCLQDDTDGNAQDKVEPKAAETVSSDKCDLAEIFKPKPGSWTCDGCYVVNGAEILKCLCCGSLKPGVKAECIKSVSGAGAQGFSSGISAGPGLGFTFVPQTPAPDSSSGFKLGSEVPAPDSSSGFKFGSGVPALNSSSGFKFGSGVPAPDSSSGFKLGSEVPASDSSSGFKLGSGVPAADSSSGFKLGSEVPASDCSSGFKLGSGVPAPDSSSGFKFGSGVPALNSSSGFKLGSEVPASDSSSGFKLGSGVPAADSSSGFKLGSGVPAPDSSSGFKFGSGVPALKSSSGFKFVSEVPAPDSSSGFKFVSEVPAADSSSGFKLGSEVPAPDSSSGFKLGSGVPAADSSSGFKLGSEVPAPDSSSGFKFGSEVPAPDSSSGFKFGSGVPALKSSSGFKFVSEVPAPDSSSGFKFVSEVPAADSSSGFKLGSEVPAPDSSSGFKLGSGVPAADSSSGFKLGSEVPAPDSSSGFKFGSGVPALNSSSGFKFGSGLPAPDSSSGFKCVSEVPASDSSSGFKLGSGVPAADSSSGFKLGSGVPAADSSSGFKFGLGVPAADSSSGFNFNTSSLSSGLFGTTTAVQPSGFGTAKTTKAGVGFVFAPQTTGSIIFAKSTTVSGTASSGFKFGTPSTSSSSSSIFSLKQSDQETNAAKTTPSSEVRPRVEFKVPSVSETKATTNVFGKGTTAQNQDPSRKLAPSSAQIQNSDKETQNKQFNKIESDETAKCSNAMLAEFLASPDSWKCYACNTSSDGTEVKCRKCSTARPVDNVSDSVSAIPANVEPKLLFGSKSNSAGFAFGSQGVKPLFSLGIGSEPKELDQQHDAKQAILSFENVQGRGSDRKLHASHISSALKTTEDGFKFTFAPSVDTEKIQPVATLGSGFNFSQNMAPLIKTAKESPSKLQSPNNSYTVSAKSPDESENSYYENKEEDDCKITFEPIIKLPDKVEVKTGEEDEEMLFSNRARLYRFWKGEWKERGIGDVKVLYHNESNKSRIVMRREHIHKICCNHYIVPELNMQPMPNTKGCALVWFAMDFTDGIPNSEKFSIKFKTEENAKMFVSAIEEAKARLKGGKSKPLELSLKSPKVETVCAVSATKAGSGKEKLNAVPDFKKSVEESDSDVIIVKVEGASDEEVALARDLMLPDNFYLYSRKPPCPGCRGCTDSDPVYQTNEDQDYEDDSGDEDDDYDEYTSEEEEEVENNNDDHEGKLEKDNHDSQDSAATESVFCGFSCQSSFASLVAAANNAFQTDDGQNSAVIESVFGGFSGQSSFASLAASANTNAFQTDPNKAAVWPGMGKPLFGGEHAQVDESDQNDDAQVQQCNDPHFEPLIPLPKLIEVVTGEEDETVEFSQRSKLFRFDKDTQQWKEKGIGEMKILKHRYTGIYRLLFRREQVHKLVCNHRLTTDINMQPLATSETSWCWSALDYSENEPKYEKLAVKFKNIDQSKIFKDKIDEIQAQLRGIDRNAFNHHR